MSNAIAAADRLSTLMRKNGPEFLRMPGSVKAYFNQELAAFPEERAVFEAAFDAGVHQQLQKVDGENREVQLQKIAALFAKQCDVHPDWARWAVNVWSSAIAERPWSSVASFDLDGTVKTNQFVIDHRFDADPQLKILRGGSPIWLKLIMTLIVVAGGFSGGFLGRCWPIAAIVCGFDLVDATIGKAEYEKLFPENRAKVSGIQKAIAFTVYFVVFGLPAALASGFGSLAGWWFGRADGRPWMGFIAAFGAAFIANTILVMTLGCIAGVVASFFVCFAAAYKVASSTT